MNSIIPDTNFLIYLAKYNLLGRLSDYSRILLLKQVLKELVVLSKSEKLKEKDRLFAQLVIEFIVKLKENIAFIENIEGNADDAIQELAEKEKIPVGTMDKALVEKLQKNKIKIIFIRQKSLLQEK